MRTPRIGPDVPADQLVLELPGLPPPSQVDPVARAPRRPPPAAAFGVAPTPVPAAAVGERVWLVWEDDEVLGIYADPQIAAAECGALRRHAYRDRLMVHYEWMAVPVFTSRRHQPTEAALPGVTGRRW